MLTQRALGWNAVLFRCCLFFLLLAAACSRPVASVNGKEIDRSAFERSLDEKRRGHRKANAEIDIEKLKAAVLNELVVTRLVLEDAEKRGIRAGEGEADKEISETRKTEGEEGFRRLLSERGMNEEQLRQRVEENIIFSRFVDSLLGEDPVTDEELRERYRNSQKPFVRPVNVLVRMIEMKSVEEAREVAAEMKREGVDFDEMAGRMKGQERAAVLDYGWTNPDFYSPDIARGMKYLKVGQSGGPFKGRNNWYLVKVRAREKETIASFDEVKEEIRAAALKEKRQTLFARWLDRKKSVSKVEIYLQ